MCYLLYRVCAACYRSPPSSPARRCRAAARVLASCVEKLTRGCPRVTGAVRYRARRAGSYILWYRYIYYGNVPFSTADLIVI